MKTSKKLWKLINYLIRNYDIPDEIIGKFDIVLQEIQDYETTTGNE